MSWNQFQESVGEEQLEEEREAYLRERRSKSRGRARRRRWANFRRAIENYVPGVQPGNQTALNAAASPFANYISAVHRRLHVQFTDNFVNRLPVFDNSPMSDLTLASRLEIVLNADGTVHRVGVVRASGYLPFDFEAYNAVMRGQPYPASPSSIRSGDGRVYFHWGFRRGNGRCGTFLAQPFILANAPSRASQGPVDGLQLGTVVPRGAVSTLGTGTGGTGGTEASGQGANDAPEGEPPAEGPSEDSSDAAGGASNRPVAPEATPSSEAGSPLEPAPSPRGEREPAEPAPG